MPFYTFKCPSCNRVEEIQQSMKDQNPICKRCDDASLGIHTPLMERVYGHTAKPQFKGEGFYETDYKQKPKEKNDNIRVDKPDFNT